MNRPASPSAIGLLLLTVLFLARVAGQALVAFFDVTWLPGMDAWFSGLLPYAVLFPIQIVILVAMVVIDRDVWLGRGLFARSRPRMGRWLRRIACVYALSMVARLLITRTHLIPTRARGRRARGHVHRH